MTSHDDVVSEQQTSVACPTQWQGQLVDGRHFYFRYRSGIAHLGFGSTEEEAVDDTIDGVGAFGVSAGDDLDGYMTDDEYAAAFDLLCTTRELD